MTIHQPIILGITGGIACGKTEVGCLLAEKGFVVLDTDTLAHKMMEKGRAVYPLLIDHFGAGIVGEDGEIDRVALGRIVFENPAARTALDGLVHPVVIEAAEEWKKSQSGNVAVLVPLLFESGWTDGWDAVVCVSAEEETVFQRLEKRGLNRTEARKRIAAQMPLIEKEEKSDFIIRNNETLDVLRTATLNVLEKIRNRGNTHE